MGVETTSPVQTVVSPVFSTVFDTVLIKKKSTYSGSQCHSGDEDIKTHII